MKTSFTRLLPAIAKSGWLPAITRTPARKTALAAAGFAAVCGSIAGPAALAQGGTDARVSLPAARPAPATAAAHAMTTAARTPAARTPAAPATESAPPAGAPAAKQLNYDYQQQVNFYYCGPAATRIAASAEGHSPSQDEVARQLGTTINGTNSAEDTTRVLNRIDGKNTYHTTAMPHRPSAVQTNRLQSDVVRAIDDGRPVVANIAGTATDTLGGVHSYDGGHYLTVVGYGDNGSTVLIADPADPIADGSYWMHTTDVANWMTHHGYSY
jgi:hypothetical protein